MPVPVFGKVGTNIIVVDYMRWKYLKKGNEEKQIIDWVNQMGRIVRRVRFDVARCAFGECNICFHYFK